MDEKHDRLMKFPKTTPERFPAGDCRHRSMIEIAIFPRGKMAITTRTVAGIPTYQKKAPPNEIPENDS
jgi:hypothetical protein